MSELLPCPFCGGPAIAAKPDASSWWSVHCQADSAESCAAQPCVERAGREEAIAAWNRRAS